MKQKIISFCAEYGVFLGAGVVMVLVAEQGGIYDSVRMILVLGVTIILIWILGALLKFIIRKERPRGRLANMIMRDKYTFPSMHALTLSSASYYVFTHSITLGVIMICITLLVTIARVQTRMHYISDMVAGCTLGIICTYFITPYIEKCSSMFIF
jgi:membrane-associated phospholipid phosphatase